MNVGKIMVLLFGFILLIQSISWAASFCCNDTTIGESKCWIEGACCNGAWYIGCPCSEHPTNVTACENAPNPPYLTFQFNGNATACNLSGWAKPANIDGYYCLCTDYDKCAWTFIPNITDVRYPTLADVDDQIRIYANITPDRSLDSTNKIKTALVCTDENCTEDMWSGKNITSSTYLFVVNGSDLGLGTHGLYISGTDVHDEANVYGPFYVTVRDIVIGSLSIQGNTTQLIINGSDIKYDNGTLVDGTVECWINTDKSNSCTGSVTNGEFSSCLIDKPELVEGTNDYTCEVSSGSINERKTSHFSLTGLIRDFKIANAPTGAIGVGSTIVFNATVSNSGDIDWVKNVYYVVRYTSGEEFCRSRVDLSPGSSKVASCSNVLNKRGTYSFQSFIIYESPSGKNITLASSDTVSITSIKVDVDLKFVGLDYGWVPACVSGVDCEANYTRGQPIIFSVSAKYWPSAVFYYECTNEYPNYCDVYYRLNTMSLWTKIVGSGNTWVGTANSTDLECEKIYELHVLVIRSGVPAETYKKFYISCQPRVTVSPNVVRLAVGQNVSKIFDVTIWNPTEYNKTFNLTMISKGVIKSWLSLNPHDPSNYMTRGNIFVKSRSGNNTEVYLSTAGKAGTYEVDFKALDLDTSNEYKSKGYIYIYAKGLPEFGLEGVLLLMIFSLLIFSFIKTGIDKTNKQR